LGIFRRKMVFSRVFSRVFLPKGPPAGFFRVFRVFFGRYFSRHSGPYFSGFLRVILGRISAFHFARVIAYFRSENQKILFHSAHASERANAPMRCFVKFEKSRLQMYTEICHFLLLHATFFANLWFASAPASRPFGRLSPLFTALPFRFGHDGAARGDVFSHASSGKIGALALFARARGRRRLRLPVIEQNYFSAFKYLWRLRRSNPLKVIFSIFFFILSICFFGTISNYVCSDFSISNTTTNSTADIPIFYKISATWSNHEGSLLLWCWLLSFNAFLFCISICITKISRFSRSYSQCSLRKNAKSFRFGKYLVEEFFPPTCHSCSDPDYNCCTSNSFLFRIQGHFSRDPKRINRKSAKSMPQNKNKFSFGKFIFAFLPRSTIFSQQYFLPAFMASAIVIFFTTFCVATSNPFNRIARLSGASINSLAELSPILQDPVLAIHPPCIYAGYVASAIAFSLCMFSPPVRPIIRVKPTTFLPSGFGKARHASRACAPVIPSPHYQQIAIPLSRYSASRAAENARRRKIREKGRKRPRRPKGVQRTTGGYFSAFLWESGPLYAQQNTPLKTRKKPARSGPRFFARKEISSMLCSN